MTDPTSAVVALDVVTSGPDEADQTFAAGARVHVMEIKGATALVCD